MSHAQADQRQQLLKQRRQLSETQHQQFGQQIFEHLIHHDLFKQAQAIALYYSLPDEVSTHKLIQHALEINKQVYLPCLVDNASMQLRLVTDWTTHQQWPRNHYNIPEPPASPGIAVDAIDLFIIPGIAFDKQGNRIGHGKGYYDRMLCNVAREKIMGLAYEFQIIDCITPNAWDIPVSMIATPRKILQIAEQIV